MKKRDFLFGLVLLVVTIFFNFALPANAQSNDEMSIMAVEQRFSNAFKAKDVNTIMSMYVPGESLIVFDVIPPRQYVGAEAYRKDWEGLFAAYPGPIAFKMTDIDIIADGSLGVSHSIQSGYLTDKNGKKLDFTVRVTDVYRKIDDKWLITHEHVSMPVDLTTGIADLSS